MSQVSIFLSAVLLSLSLLAPPARSTQEPTTYLEFLTWKGAPESGRTLLEVYGLLDVRYFAINQIFGEYAVNYGIELRIIDAQGNDAGPFYRTDYYSFPSSKERNRPRLRRFHVSVELEPGLYQVQISARDLNSLASLTTTAEVEVPDYSGESLKISSLQLSGINARDIPTILGIIDDSALRIQAEIYNVDFKLARANQPLEVWVELKSEREQTVLTYEGRIQKTGPTTGLVVRMPTCPLPNGRYQLRIEVADPDSGESIRASTDFDLTSTEPEMVLHLK